MSNNISTQRLTEDVQSEQKKILLRSSIVQPLDGLVTDADGFYNITMTETLPNVKASDLSYDIIYTFRLSNTIFIYPYNYREVYPGKNYNSVYSYITNASGQLSLVVKIRTSLSFSNLDSITVYYVLYTTRSATETLL